MTTDLTIGVFGAAKISGRALLQPALDTAGVTVTTIAARDRSRAQTQADEFQIADVVATYDDVLASDVDAIYNPLPINLHHEWTLKAIAAGKHVLCEKPFASNAVLAQEMVDAAEAAGVVLVEAFHWRFHPLASRIAERLNDVGEVHHVDAGFSVEIPPSDDVRQSYELAGGALMDLGCYPAQWIRFVGNTLGFGEPAVVSASMVEGRQNADVTTNIDLRFDNDVTAHLYTAMHPGCGLTAYLEVQGSAGVLRVQNPIAPHDGHELVFTPAGGASVGEVVDGKTTYHHQLEAFRAAVVDGTPVPTGGSDAVANMALIDASYLAAGLPIRGA
jgi:predicted dehydrogenase